MLGGASAWLAPERLNPEDGTRHPPTFQSDIWSFSMVCIEVRACCFPKMCLRSSVQLYTGHDPFHNSKSFTTFLSVLRGDRPNRPRAHHNKLGVNDAVWDLIQNCWAHNPSDRPTSRDLLKRLHRAIDGDNASHQVLRLILADKDTSVHLSVMDVEELKQLCNFVDEVNESVDSISSSLTDFVLASLVPLKW